MKPCSSKRALRSAGDIALSFCAILRAASGLICHPAFAHGFALLLGDGFKFLAHRGDFSGCHVVKFADPFA